MVLAILIVIGIPCLISVLQFIDELWKYIKEGDYVYFVHSYFAALSDATASSSEYGIEFTAAVSDGNVYGCQFHPEKSGDVGLNILRGFCEA